MGKTNLATIVASTRQFVSKRSPEILTGIGIAGMISTAVLAVMETLYSCDRDLRDIHSMFDRCKFSECKA